MVTGATMLSDAKREPLKTVSLLTIGNSFSKNATKYLDRIAASRGRKFELRRADLGGCSLKRHWENAQSGEKAYYGKNRSLKDMLKWRDYDMVTIQQVSFESFKPESYQPYAENLIKFIRENAPNAEIMVHQTWAYRPDHYFFARKEMDLDQDKMFEGLKACYDDLANKYGLRVLPSGEAMRRCRQTQPVKFTFPDPKFDYKNPVYPQTPDQEGSLIKGWWWREKDGKKQLILDSKHANVRGEYLQGCVWYEVLFGDNAENVTFVPEGITPEDAAFLRKVAHETVVERMGKGRK